MLNVHYCGSDYSSYFHALRESSVSILTSGWYEFIAVPPTNIAAQPVDSSP